MNNLSRSNPRHARNSGGATVKQVHLLVTNIVAVGFIVLALLVGWILGTGPFTTQGDYGAVPRSGCQMVCLGPTLAGQCVGKKVVWRPPYPCVPSTY